MNWHTRYLQQAAWTRGLRVYLFERAGMKTARRVLEVGCGTGAILRELSAPALCGLDLDAGSLSQCRIHAPAALLTLGDGHFLPYPDKSFDIVYCHYFLLWVKDPLQTLREMARVGRSVLALAEPDYSRRVDEPPSLKPLGGWQTEALRRQGANPSFGASLAETFYRAGIQLVETGPIQAGAVVQSPEDWETEWKALQSDLNGILSAADIQTMKNLDENARRCGTRVLHVPTFFAWGKT